MNLYMWAARWGIPVEALDELREELGLTHIHTDHMSEAGVSQRAQLRASHMGWLLMRNNVGAYRDDSGRVVRYGLMNETAQQNERYKSSDFIGVKPLVVTERMVGTTVGVFVAREMKHRQWQWGGTAHEQAQLAFLGAVAARGADAKFCNDPEDLE